MSRPIAVFLNNITLCFLVVKVLALKTRVDALRFVDLALRPN